MRTLSCLLLALFIGIPSALAQSFSDTAGEPQQRAIDSLQAEGIVEGYSDGTFRPRSPINRAEFLAILLRSEVGEDAIDELLARIRIVNFPDVPSDSWYWRYVTYARASGIIDGYPDGRFRPEWSINLAEAAKIGANVFNVPPVHIECIRAPCDPYWYGPYVRALDQRGALPSDVWSNADRSLTRGEMAYMTYILRGGTVPTAIECLPAGCSGQLCVPAAEADQTVTTCEWRDEYACYETARCEQQSDGQCGWTMTNELQSCLRGS